MGWLSVADVLVVRGAGKEACKGLVKDEVFYAPSWGGGNRSAIRAKVRYVGRFARAVWLLEPATVEWFVTHVTHVLTDTFPLLLLVPLETRRGAAFLLTWRVPAQQWDLLAALVPEMSVVAVPEGGAVFAERLVTPMSWQMARYWPDLLIRARETLLREWNVTEPREPQLGSLLNRPQNRGARHITNMRAMGKLLVALVPRLRWGYSESVPGYYGAALALVNSRVFVTPHGAAGGFNFLQQPGSVFAEVLSETGAGLGHWADTAIAGRLVYVVCRVASYGHYARRPMLLPEPLMREFVRAVAAVA